MNFILEQTKTTPYVNFANGSLLIRGNFFPTLGKDLYKNLSSLIEIYSKHPLPKTMVKIDMDIINCYSKRFILNTLRKFEVIKSQKKDIIIIWFYEEEDDDMLELGYIMQSLIALPFNFIPKFNNRK